MRRAGLKGDLDTPSDNGLLSHNLKKPIENHMQLVIGFRLLEQCVRILAFALEPVAIFINKSANLVLIHFRVRLNPPNHSVSPPPNVIGAVLAIGEYQYVGMIGPDFVPMPHEGTQTLRQGLCQRIRFAGKAESDFIKTCFPDDALEYLVTSNQCRGEDLAAEAQSQHRHTCLGQLFQNKMLALNPRFGIVCARNARPHENTRDLPWFWKLTLVGLINNVR